MINLPIKYEQLYFTKFDGSIGFNFKALSVDDTSQNCSFVLQTQFLQQNYLTILRDYNQGKEKFFIFFEKIETTDFKGVGVFISTLVVLIIVALLVLLGYVIYRCMSNIKERRESIADIGDSYRSISEK